MVSSSVVIGRMREARTGARRTGAKSLWATVVSSRERVIRPARQHRERERRFGEIMAIAEHCANLPVLDSRHPDEILGYDEHGLPH